jgi:ornithine carbamoyltransferase
MKRDFTKLLDITSREGLYLLDRGLFMKQVRKAQGRYKPLSDKSLGMIFHKASTRTRISFEVGINELGGNAIFLNQAETQMGRGEPIRDTARVLSRYVHGIMVRTHGQEIVEELAQWATIPVINGLSDLYHPCQILSDVFTMREYKGSVEGLKVSYIGDGNNIANSWIEAAILFGFHLSLACPDGYRPNGALLEKALNNASVTLTDDPKKAVEGVDVINTDVWVSMGMEEEQEERKKVFKSYIIDDVLLKTAKKDAIVMHCLPAYRGQEISEDVFEHFQDVIFTQAENRLYVQKALLEWVMTEDTKT